jgi:hypothetical protein
MGTAVKRATKSPDFWERGAAYGIKGEAVDGMDVLAVKAAGEKAVAACRAGKGPYILEVMTYRYRGHSMSDPAKYRTREEVQEMREKRDAIEQVKRQSVVRQAWRPRMTTQGDRQGIRKDMVTEAADFAQNDPEPDVSELWTDIYATSSAATPEGETTDMATEILMPALSPTMEEGKLAKWLVKEGDRSRRRHHRRDRDRQGHDGIRGRRRRHHGQDPGRRGHRGREGQQPHRHPCRRRRGRAGGRRRQRWPAQCPRRRWPPRHCRCPGPRCSGLAARRPAAAEINASTPTGPQMPRWSRRPSARRSATPWPKRCAAMTTVFVMGEEVAEYQGAYKISQGLLDEFGARRVIDE